MSNYRWYKEEGSFKRNRSVYTGRKISRVMIDNINDYLERMKRSKSYTGVENAYNECLGYLRALWNTGAIDEKLYDRYFKLLLNMYSRLTLKSLEIKKREW